MPPTGLGTIPQLYTQQKPEQFSQRNHQTTESVISNRIEKVHWKILFGDVNEIPFKRVKQTMVLFSSRPSILFQAPAFLLRLFEWKKDLSEGFLWETQLNIYFYIILFISNINLLWGTNHRKTVNNRGGYIGGGHVGHYHVALNQC